MDEPLNLAERKQLHQALLSAFPSEGALEQVFFFELGVNLRQIREGRSYSEIVGNLILWAETNNRLQDLLAGARNANPGNRELRRFLEDYQAHHAPSGATKRPSAVLTPQRRIELIQLLLRIPASGSFEGRSAFLIGLVWAQSLTRSPTNSRMDLDMIIDQLDSLGQLDSGAWPLLIFLQNAASYVDGTAVGRELQKMSQQLTEAYQEKANA